MNKRNWFPISGAVGRHSRQAHTNLPEGTYEREVSKEGFFGPASFLYHRRPPTSWTHFEGPLRPRAFNLSGMVPPRTSPWESARILFNHAVEIRFWHLSSPMPNMVRNGDGDQLLFVHDGAGDLFCDYGHIAYEQGDYIVIPRGTTWKLTSSNHSMFLMIESTNSHFTLPDKGLLGSHALFDPALFDIPVMDEAFVDYQEVPGTFTVDIKKRGQLSRMTFNYNPLDAVGWHGNLAPVRINVRDIRPVMSHRYHLPPSVHTTFLADRFVVCTFVPRPFETDPAAIKVPFFHNNDDYDEVLFYHAGQFFSRDHISPGMMTFHPAGFTHGPHPNALKGMFMQPGVGTDEYAVMIDARDPLEAAAEVSAIEEKSYVDSWKSDGSTK